jgi:hypothetical protein
MRVTATPLPSVNALALMLPVTARPMMYGITAPELTLTPVSSL